MEVMLEKKNKKNKKTLSIEKGSRGLSQAHVGGYLGSEALEEQKLKIKK